MESTKARGSEAQQTRQIDSVGQKLHEHFRLPWETNTACSMSPTNPSHSFTRFSLGCLVTQPLLLCLKPDFYPKVCHSNHPQKSYWCTLVRFPSVTLQPKHCLLPPESRLFIIYSLIYPSLPLSTYIPTVHLFSLFSLPLGSIWQGWLLPPFETLLSLRLFKAITTTLPYFRAVL